MYEYTWYQWLTFFYVYCFFGWIFESTYVSIKKRHFVNRGFLRLPMLPLYGTGAVMMLWVSLPVKDNLVLVYFAGVVAATVLEYVTGWGMERLFKMKYWDYSNQRFNLRGYICLSSSIAWGFLTIFLTEVIHRPIESYVLGLPITVDLVCVTVITVLFTVDTAESVKTALDLAKVLDAMTNMRAELDELQVQMALLKAEANQRMSEARDETALRLDLMRAEATAKAGAFRDEATAKAGAFRDEAAAKADAFREEAAAKAGAFRAEATAKAGAFRDGATAKAGAFRDEAAGKLGSLVEGTAGRMNDLMENTTDKLSGLMKRPERLDALSQRMAEMTEKRQLLLNRMSFYHRSLLRGNPTASSSRFAEALQELKEALQKEKK